MITPGINQYEVVLANRYYLRELLEGITLSESLDQIAYQAEVKLVVTPDFPGIVPGQEIRVSGVPFGQSSMAYLLHPGVVWEISSDNKGQKHLTVNVYDRTIYLNKSEDEYLFPAGGTASQRLQQYASDWSFSLWSVPDTEVALAKAVYRAQSIFSMVQKDLKETAQKGGSLYRLRYWPGAGLELYEIGTNGTVWVLDYDQNVEEITQKRTLEGTITQVKVLGNAGEDERSPVLAIVKVEADAYGTLQKVLSDSKITTAGDAQTAGEKLLCGITETFSVQSIDVNTLRAGDKIILGSTALIVCSVEHELGNPGKMSLELGSMDYVRRKYFSDQ